jgi:hypothetical protein
MPTTGPQCCTNEQLKTTVLTDAVSHVDAWKRTLIMYSNVPATVEAILVTKPNTSSWTISPSIIPQHLWQKWLCKPSIDGSPTSNQT